MTDSSSAEEEWAIRLIERYLARHPDASDTLDGVVRWWLTRQCYEEAQAVAEAALATLVQRGVIRARRGKDNRIIYERFDGDA